MGHITPNHFPLMVSIEFIMMNIVGGPGSIFGILLGTILVTILPYFLLFLVQALSSFFPMVVVHFADIRLVIYGAIIVGFLMYVPGGFHGLLVKIPKILGEKTPQPN
jgi:branched-chain amino acid transport system permease protein